MAPKKRQRVSAGGRSVPVATNIAAVSSVQTQAAKHLDVLYSLRDGLDPAFPDEPWPIGRGGTFVDFAGRMASDRDQLRPARLCRPRFRPARRSLGHREIGCLPRARALTARSDPAAGCQLNRSCQRLSQELGLT